MVIRNKKTGEYLLGIEGVNGKAVIRWIKDKRQAWHVPSHLQTEWKIGYYDFQKKMNVELELEDEENED